MTIDTDKPLAHAHVGPIIAISDTERSRAFYEEALGLRGEPAPGGGHLLHAGGGSVIFLLEQVDDAGSATWPVASFQVDDVREAVIALRERGVAFRTDLPFDQDELGIADQGELTVAWMADPDGNVITVFAVA